MAQTRGTFVELYDNIDKAVFTLLFDAQKELPRIWTKVFNVKTSDKKFERVMSITGMGDVPEKGEGAPYTSDIIRAGYTKDFTHTEYGMMFEVTQTALEDDQYDQLAQHARWLMFSARVVEEKKAHAVFNNGFTTELSPDGAAIFASSHTLKAGGTGAEHPEHGRGPVGHLADAGAHRPAEPDEGGGGAARGTGGGSDPVRAARSGVRGGPDPELGGPAGECGQRPQPDQVAPELDAHRESVSDGQRCVVHSAGRTRSSTGSCRTPVSRSAWSRP